MGCAVGCARLLLIGFNFVFWLSGVAILGVGVWILVDPNLQDFIDVVHITEDEHFRNAAYILIAFGAFIFLVGFCGCCGAIRNSKCLLGFYILFLVMVFAGELAAGILAAVYKTEIIKKFETELGTSIKIDYREKSSWDVVQAKLECCGGVSVNDYDNSTWQTKQQPGIKIPASCCILSSDGNPENEDECKAKISKYFEQPCKDKLVQWVESHSVILIGVGCGIAGLQIFGLIFAILLCRSVDQEKY